MGFIFNEGQFYRYFIVLRSQMEPQFYYFNYIFAQQMTNYKDPELFKTFIEQIKSGNIQSIQQSISQHPDLVNAIDTQINESPLYYAVVNNDDETSAQMLKMLIRKGANINFKDSIEQTVLFYGCRQGKLRSVEVLINSGLSMDEPDQYNQTPLFYAVGDNQLEIVRKYGTKDRVNHADRLADQTPLYYAAKKGHFEMCKLLIQKGAQIAHSDKSNKTAADLARKYKFHEAADYLAGQLKRYRQQIKYSAVSQSVEESGIEKKKKKEDSKPIRQTYKIVQCNEKGQLKDLTEDEVRQLIQNNPDLETYLCNPEALPQEMIARASNYEPWEKIATKVLGMCCRLKGAFWFQEPVDPMKFNILDYHDVIKEPMDLGTIRKKLSHNYYSGVRDFAYDMNLVWKNCYKYNGQEHDISKCAKELEQGFKEYYVSQGLNKFEGGKQ